jgi:hypothetical protein
VPDFKAAAASCTASPLNDGAAHPPGGGTGNCVLFDGRAMKQQRHFQNEQTRRRFLAAGLPGVFVLGALRRRQHTRSRAGEQDHPPEKEVPPRAPSLAGRPGPWSRFAACGIRLVAKSAPAIIITNEKPDAGGDQRRAISSGLTIQTNPMHTELKP